MTEKELKCDGWEPRLCRVGRLYFNEPYFCRLDGETVILFSTTDDMHPIGQAKTLDDIKQLQMSHEAEELKALEYALVMAKQLFFEKYGNREKRRLTASEILDELKAECNRRMDELWNRLPDAHIVDEDKYTRDDAFVTGQYNTFEEILRRIKSLEKKTSESHESEDEDTRVFGEDKDRIMEIIANKENYES